MCRSLGKAGVAYTIAVPLGVPLCGGVRMIFPAQASSHSFESEVRRSHLIRPGEVEEM